MLITTVNDDAKRTSLLLVVIEKQNLERMKQADPLTLAPRSEGGTIMPKVRYPEGLGVMICYEEEDAEIYRLAREGNTADLLRHLMRGYRFDPRTDGTNNQAEL